MAYTFNPFTGNFDVVGGAQNIDGRVSTVADLPVASLNPDKIYAVETTTGVPFINRKPAGMYYSDGVNWTKMPESLQADKVLYDNTTSGLLATDVQNAIDEISTVGASADTDWLKTDDTKPTDINDNIYTLGNVGVGTNNPSLALEVATRSSFDGIEIHSGSGTGTENVALGLNNLLLQSTGAVNIAIGRLALRLNDTGSGNVAIGSTSLALNTTGSSNVGIGSNSLSRNTAGVSNVALGVNAMQSNVSGSSNIGIGNSAIRSNISGASNTAIGIVALRYNVGGSRNVAIGPNSMERAETSNTVAIGSFSARDVTTNNDNSVFIGRSACATGAGGEGVTVIGAYSGTNIEADKNTVIGYGSAQDLTTGTNNLVIGSDSGGGLTTGSNNIIIGGNVASLPPTLSNNIIIADGQGNQRLTVDNNGIVNISNTNNVIGKTLGITSTGDVGIIEEQSSLVRFEGNVTQTVSTTLVDLTPLLGPLTSIFENQNFVTYDSVNQVFKADATTTNYYTLSILLKISGTITVSGTNDHYSEVYLTRPNGNVIATSIFSRSKSAPTAFTEIEAYGQDTFVFSGGLDPFQVDGFKLQAKVVGGNDLDITGNQDLRFYRV